MVISWKLDHLTHYEKWSSDLINLSEQSYSTQILKPKSILMDEGVYSMWSFWWYDGGFRLFMTFRSQELNHSRGFDY